MREWVGDREGGLTDEGERVRLGSVKNSNIFLLEIESLRLGFTFSKPSLRNSISKWQNSTWRAHVELEFLRLEFHVDTPRGIWPRRSRVSETRFTKSETKSQKLDF